MKINRSARLALLLVLLFSSFSAAPKSKLPPAKPLDINSATVQQLEQVPGIGPSIANSIVRTREKSGPYHRLEDLLAIRGINTHRLDKLRPYLTVASLKHLPTAPGSTSH